MNLSRLIPTIFLLSSSLLVSIPATANDKDALWWGKTLHDPYCLKCHNSGMYTRRNRIVNSMPALESRVKRCETNSASHWNTKEIDTVIEYLNSKYYQFPD